MKKFICGVVYHYTYRCLENLLGGSPLAAYGRNDCAFLLQLGKSLIYFLAVNACDFRNLSSVDGSTELTHSL